jgi:hypothetical protein
MIHVQMTPIPQGSNLENPDDKFKAFMDDEANSFQTWANLENRKQVIADILPGFEHNFLLLRSPSEDEKLLSRYRRFRGELSGDVVIGDVGTTSIDGQRFSDRCRWVLKDSLPMNKALLVLLVIIGLLLLIFV